jgi:hypothetical protein
MRDIRQRWIGRYEFVLAGIGFVGTASWLSEDIVEQNVGQPCVKGWLTYFSFIKR